MQHPSAYNTHVHTPVNEGHAGPAASANSETERLRGIVDRVTYHNEVTGYSVLRVIPRGNPGRQETVIVHQMRVFAGATMEFYG